MLEKSRGLALDLLGEFPGKVLVEEHPGRKLRQKENVQLFLRGLEEGHTQQFDF